MGPFTPPAKGGYSYVSKFTDDYSRMKEVYLLRNKSEAAELLHQYNTTVAVPLGLRIEIVRCDKGGEYIGKEFKTLCVNAGINVKYTATNTPQQNEVSERDGQTLAQITRCLMKDGNFPPSLWGELIFAAAYLSNRSPHSALGGATPYSRMHNKDTDLSGLRALGARAFVHRETYRRKLDDRAFEGKLCRLSQDSRAYRIYDPVKVTVVESRNVTCLKTPAYSLRLGVTSEDYHYEEDVLRFTSALDGPLMAEDTFDGEDVFSAMEQEARIQHLRQEEWRLSRMNATYRELPTSPQPLSASPGVVSDNSGVTSPSIVLGTTGEPVDASPGAAPSARTTPAAENAPTHKPGDVLRSLEPVRGTAPTTKTPWTALKSQEFCFSPTLCDRIHVLSPSANYWRSPQRRGLRDRDRDCGFCSPGWRSLCFFENFRLHYWSSRSQTNLGGGKSAPQTPQQLQGHGEIGRIGKAPFRRRWAA